MRTVQFVALQMQVGRTGQVARCGSVAKDMARLAALTSFGVRGIIRRSPQAADSNSRCSALVFPCMRQQVRQPAHAAESDKHAVHRAVSFGSPYRAEVNVALRQGQRVKVPNSPKAQCAVVGSASQHAQVSKSAPIRGPQMQPRPNTSFEATRYGSQCLAAPGHSGHRPSAASHRLPPRSPQLQR